MIFLYALEIESTLISIAILPSNQNCIGDNENIDFQQSCGKTSLVD